MGFNKNDSEKLYDLYYRSFVVECQKKLTDKDIYFFCQTIAIAEKNGEINFVKNGKKAHEMGKHISKEFSLNATHKLGKAQENAVIKARTIFFKNHKTFRE